MAKQVAEIISYNIFQMNGLNKQIPYSATSKSIQLNLFENDDSGVELEDNPACLKKLAKQKVCVRR
ncbi:hypothetical protein [Veillonella atypica]|uniref:hypothetical protein n=1 Tax=Veillonella atypica TaxID=39777 RepID=UPI0018E0697D|nr:hypothetical protein [Veillonella atypica]